MGFLILAYSRKRVGIEEQATNLADSIDVRASELRLGFTLWRGAGLGDVNHTCPMSHLVHRCPLPEGVCTQDQAGTVKIRKSS